MAALGWLLFMLCMCANRGSAQGVDAMQWAMEGRKLSPDAVGKLELQVKAAPGDVEARTKLLGYYMQRAFSSPEARTARQQHILWLIRNRPDEAVLDTPFGRLDLLDGSAYEDGKKAWLEQVDRRPKEAALLGRAAGYLLLHDAAMAENLYRRAEAADPQNAEWPSELGHLYQLGIARETGEARQAKAKAALAAYERSLQRVQGEAAIDRASLLPDAARMALEAGDLAKARSYADELLAAGSASRDWMTGNAIHQGHLILGRIALRGHDLAQAKEHLLAAGKTPGSPQLNSFGPNMSLAKELLEAGERQAVLEYLKLCRSFWNRGELEAWSKEIQAAKIPDFGANLEY
jgi:hypothetical protein